MLKRNPSTISREIKRGITINGTYFAESTERLIRVSCKGSKSALLVIVDRMTRLTKMVQILTMLVNKKYKK